MERVAIKIDPKTVQGMMGISDSGLGLTMVSWVLIQEEANGVDRGVVAQGLGVTIQNLKALEEAATGFEGDESTECWNRGIIALKTAIVMNAGVIEHGWDSIEALAIEKLQNALSAMQSNGDADQMLRIASAANRAVRRDRGERQMTNGNGGNRVQDGGGIDITLRSGNLGSMTLQFSPKIQEQLGRPGRVIEGIGARLEAEKNNPRQKLEMLRLDETRGLADSSNAKLDAQALLDDVMTVKGNQRKHGGATYDFGDLMNMQGIPSLVEESTDE